MDTALPQKFPFISDRNLAKATCTRNRICTSCDIVVLAVDIICRTTREVFLFLSFKCNKIVSHTKFARIYHTFYLSHGIPLECYTNLPSLMFKELIQKIFYLTFIFFCFECMANTYDQIVFFQSWK